MFCKNCLRPQQRVKMTADSIIIPSFCNFPKFHLVFDKPKSVLPYYNTTEILPCYGLYDRFNLESRIARKFRKFYCNCAQYLTEYFLEAVLVLFISSTCNCFK